MSYYENAIKMRPIIEKAVASLSDAEGLDVPTLFPKWDIGIYVKSGERYYYIPNKTLYKVREGQSHTTQETWAPDIAATLWEPVDVSHSGGIDDPISAVAGMTYVKGLYYIDPTDGNVYLCTRQDTPNGTVLHYLPHELVGIYFSVV